MILHPTIPFRISQRLGRLAATGSLIMTVVTAVVVSAVFVSLVRPSGDGDLGHCPYMAGVSVRMHTRRNSFFDISHIREGSRGA